MQSTTKVIAVIFATLFVLVSSESNCDSSLVQTCWDDFLPLMFDFQEQDEDKVCKNLEDSINCLRTSLAGCIEENSEEEELLNELDNMVNYACTEDEEDSEVLSVTEEEDTEDDACISENSEYIFGCLAEGKREILSLLLRNGRNVSANELKCTMYSVLAECFIERVTEKCGVEAGKSAREEMDDLPEDIRDACEAAEAVEMHSVQRLKK